MILGFFVALVDAGASAGVEEAVGVTFSARITEGRERLAITRVRRVFLIMGVEG
jgi:hypothetical protein